jgi:leucyl-tRNA synthetase
MELINSLSKFSDNSINAQAIRHEVLESIVIMLSPIVPHICSQLWRELGHENELINQPWLVIDESALIQDELELVVQINGKLRGKVIVPASATKEEIEAIALNDETVLRFIDGQTIKKLIVVPKKLVNIVV